MHSRNKQTLPFIKNKPCFSAMLDLHIGYTNWGSAPWLAAVLLRRGPCHLYLVWLTWEAMQSFDGCLFTTFTLFVFLLFSSFALVSLFCNSGIINIHTYRFSIFSIIEIFITFEPLISRLKWLRLIYNDKILTMMSITSHIQLCLL